MNHEPLPAGHRWGPPRLLAFAYVVLVAAWLMGNPPGSAPDEYSHYLRALGAGRGQLLLSEKPPRPDFATMPLGARWQYETSRMVDLPPALDPAPLVCSAYMPDVTAACLYEPSPRQAAELHTTVGTYEPFVYVPAGLLMRLAGEPRAADRLGRLGLSLLSALFLVLAVHLVWDPRAGNWSLLGLIAAATPMVVFMASVLSPNNVEIAAGVCFVAGLLRLARGVPESAGVWAAVGAAGAALTLSRATGPLWAAASLAALVVVAGPREVVAIARRGGRRAAGTAAAVGLGTAATVLWEALVQPQPSRRLGETLAGIPDGAGRLLELWHNGIGLFGWLDTGMSPWAYRVWTILLVALLAAALLLGTWRQRVALVVLVVSAIFLVLLVDSLNRPTGFEPQARYFLPFVGVVPLYAGEVLRARRLAAPALLPLWLVPLAAAAAAGVQFHAWFVNARRYAVGAGGPSAFIGPAEWSPPLGWVPWLALAGLAALLIVGAGLGAPPSGPPLPAEPRR